MRIAIISDIHGNCVALDAVLADLKHHPTDQMVCLGDAIQGGPQPAQVVARLRDLACPVVMGNADAWMLTGVDTGAEKISEERMRTMSDVRLWSLGQLSPEDQKTIAAYQPTISLPIGEDRALLCFHGSPRSFDEVLLPGTPEEEFQAILGEYVPNLLTGGHTHIQQKRRLGVTRSYYINPGSVGFAYSHQQPEGSFHADPWAEYAVLTIEDGRSTIEFMHIPFDVEALVESYHSSGRPHPDGAIAQYQS